MGTGTRVSGLRATVDGQHPLPTSWDGLNPGGHTTSVLLQGFVIDDTHGRVVSILFFLGGGGGGGVFWLGFKGETRGNQQNEATHMVGD